MEQKKVIIGALMLSMSMAGCIGSSEEGLSGRSLVILSGALEVGQNVVFGMSPDIARSMQINSAVIADVGDVSGSCMVVLDKINCTFTESGPLTMRATAQTNQSVDIAFSGNILDPNGLAQSTPKIVVTFLDDASPVRNEIGTAATVQADRRGDRRLERNQGYFFTFAGYNGARGSRAQNHSLSNLIAEIDLGDGNGLQQVNPLAQIPLNVNWVGPREMTAYLSTPNRNRTTELKFNVVGFCLPTTNPIALNVNNVSIAHDIGNWHTINAIPGISGGPNGANYLYSMDVNGDHYTDDDTRAANGALRLPIIYENFYSDLQTQSLKITAMEDQCFSTQVGTRTHAYNQIPRPARGGGDVWIRARTRGINGNPRINADRDVNVINQGTAQDPALVTPMLQVNNQTGFMSIRVYGGVNFFNDDPDKAHGVSIEIAGVQRTGTNSFDTSGAYVVSAVRVDDVKKDSGSDEKLVYESVASSCQITDINVWRVSAGSPCAGSTSTTPANELFHVDASITGCVMNAFNQQNQVRTISGVYEFNAEASRDDACTGGGGGGGGNPPIGF